MHYLLLSAILGASEPTPQQATFFQQKVRPVLESACFKCHSHEAKKSKGGLVVDSLAALLKGGESGPAVVPGDLGKSLLVKAIRFEDDDIRMPPNGKLPEEQIAILVEWVRQGAPWPGATKETAEPSNKRIPGKITEEDRQWWAFQPLKPVAVPEGAAKNPIDRFLQDRLKKEGLTSSPPADRRTLVRRLYFDLIGLPPSPADVEAFVNDASPDYYEKLVDRLLTSPRHGEKWARHWLDLVRYAESDGYRIDEYRPLAWRYRDYVIRSLNDDKPYDRFLKEQLAGDELFPDEPDALIGTAYLRHWIYEYNQRDVRTQWQNILDDVTDVTGEAILGLGMGCARCHDHKFDPILQKDYYRLQAFFAGIQPEDYQTLATPEQQKDYYRKLEAWKAKAAPVLAQIEALEKPERARAEQAAISKFPPDIQVMMRKPLAERTPFEKQLAGLAYRQVIYEFDRLDKRFKDEKKQKLTDLKIELAKFDAQKPAPLPIGLIVRDVGPEAPSIHIPKKSKGEAIAPGYLTILDEKPATVASLKDLPTTGRRSTLAMELTRPDHPLTTRVIVNRIWQQHFGMGLVATPSDFGKLGEKPTHPELLDWLAQEFVRGGWKFKQLHRLIVTSDAYRQSATEPATKLALTKDPQNRLLWRMSTRRLEAEQIRDAILAVTGRLDLREGGPSVDVSQPRRTIYTKMFRNSRDALLEVFDAPEGVSSVGIRNVTTTPTQALLLINSQFMVSQAQAFAAKLDGNDAAKLDAAFRLAFGRSPSAEEKQQALAFLSQQGNKVDPKMEGPTFAHAKMPYREGRAALMQGGPSQPHLVVADSPMLPAADFTLEAFVLLKSVYEDGKVRPIASHGNADQGPGWLFGVTSKKSAHKPQMLVLQMWGENEKGVKDYEPVFSNVQIDLNKPYYVGVAVKVGDMGKTGVTFYAKDLSNDQDPLHVFQTPHRVVKMPPQRGPFSLGGGISKNDRSWDGLLDDVRLSKSALSEDTLLLNVEGVASSTVGFWQFEPTPGAYKDSTKNGLDIARAVAAQPRDARSASWVDFCQVLLNANEFLYVD